ncbi:MAG: FAD-dependent oxidoreductase [Solirubrobacterales bacterium]
MSAVPDVAIVGGGPIGLACARMFGERGVRTVVYDAAEPAAAWRVSAGMLSPTSEADYGQSEWLRLATDALGDYEFHLDGLRDETGVDLEFRRCDTLAVALDANERAALARRHALLRDELGLDVEWLDAAGCRAAEPAISPRVLAGLRTHGEAHVNPRRLVEALEIAAVRLGAEIEHARVTSLEVAGVGARVGLANGSARTFGHAVLCAGAWSAAIDGPGADLPVRPVRGQILRLKLGGGGAPRQMVHSGARYLFARAGGEIVLGASVEEQGFDASALAGETQELLEDGARVVPGAREYALTEVAVGMRPATPDNLPIVGRLAPGLHVATGHFRTGILLAFSTASAIGDSVAGTGPPMAYAALSPARHEVADVLD